MNGRMMNYPLTLSTLLERAQRMFPEHEIVSRLEDESLHRITYAELTQRVLRLMTLLQRLGVRPGDRVATFAWNSHRHLELYFAIPCMGAILHTVNVRLEARQLASLVEHANDRWIFVDRCLVERLQSLLPELPALDGIVVMDDQQRGSAQGIEGALDYESELSRSEPATGFPAIDEEQAAGLCYTSATTGDPKGVLYSHRAYVLHSFGGGMVDSMAVGQAETVMPVVPMFHANAWGFPYTSTFTGAKQVLPGMHLGGAHLADLIERERVTLAAGVPTAWSLVLASQHKEARDLSSLKSLIVGGSAVPLSLMRAYDEQLGIRITQAWGMTETTPVGCCARLKPAQREASLEEQHLTGTKQGIPVPGVEVLLEGEDGTQQPWDGEHAGELCVRGPWVADAYFGEEPESDSSAGHGFGCASSPFFEDSRGRRWFRTGDIATIDALGFIEITDRKKDLIKSRGEWISSVELENAVMDHPAILEAAVTGRRDELRDEAPVLWVVPHAEARNPPSAADLVALLAQRFARWQLPKLEDVHFIDAVPKTSVGKFDKQELRRRLAEAPPALHHERG